MPSEGRILAFAFAGARALACTSGPPLRSPPRRASVFDSQVPRSGLEKFALYQYPCLHPRLGSYLPSTCASRGAFRQTVQIPKIYSGPPGRFGGFAMWFGDMVRGMVK